MDDRDFELAKLSILNEQIESYNELIKMLQDTISRLATTEAQYGNIRASLLTEAEEIERRHYRLD